MNNNDMKQIGERLAGLRDALGLSPEEFAATCEIPTEEYLEYESGDKDLTIALLRKIAVTHGVDVSVLMFGEEPRMNSYFLTRKGKGLSVKRVEEYQYQSLAGHFGNRKADIFEVTVEPKPEDTRLHLSSHAGQEFNLVIEGRMLLQVNGKDLILNAGDSLYFDSSAPHGMKALDGKRVKFIAVIM